VPSPHRPRISNTSSITHPHSCVPDRSHAQLAWSAAETGTPCRHSRKRLDLNRLPASQRYKRHDKRWKRYEKPLPGHRVQLDVRFIQPLPASQAGSRRKHYQFTAIDDCTRLRVLRIYPKLNQKTAIQFVDYVLERLPFRVEVIQTDNGVEFGSSFHWHLLDKGIGHDYIKPRTPRLNGKVERSHRIDAEEFYQLLEGVVIDDTEVFNDKLREWENFYNYHRPTVAWVARPPMRDSSNEPRPACNQPPSVAHLVVRR
jgi:transposase InsO family protein